MWVGDQFEFAANAWFKNVWWTNINSAVNPGQSNPANGYSLFGNEWVSPSEDNYLGTMILPKDYIIEFDLQIHGTLDGWGEFINFLPTDGGYTWPLGFWTYPGEPGHIEIGTGTETAYQNNFISELPLDQTMKIRVLVIGAKKWIWIDDTEIVFEWEMGIRHRLEVDFWYSKDFSPALVSCKNLWLMEVNFLEFTIESGDMFIPT